MSIEYFKYSLTSDEKSLVDLIENEIKKVESKIIYEYYLLGKCMCESVEKKALEINLLVDKLIEMKQELISRSHAKVCPYCLTLNPEIDQTCKKCGKIIDFENT